MSDDEIIQADDADGVLVVPVPVERQPANWDAVVNGLWRPPVVLSEAEQAAARAARVAAPADNLRPSEAAWDAWRNAGGFTGDNLSARGWLDQLSRREW